MKRIIHFGLIALVALVATLPRCAPLQSPSAGSQIQHTDSVPIPKECNWFVLVPKEFDPWVYRQTVRPVFTTPGTQVAVHPGNIHVLSGPVEFHVGNQSFFYGLGLRGRDLSREVDAATSTSGEAGFVVTAPRQYVEANMQAIPVPPGFDGWIVFLLPDGVKTKWVEPVKPVLRRVSNNPRGGDGKKPRVTRNAGHIR